MKDMLTGALWGLLVLIVITLLCGCRTVRYVPIETVRTDSVYVDRWQRDSVYVRDSVFVNQYSKGDTLFVDKVVTKYKYKDRWRYDTVAVVRADSVQVPSSALPCREGLGLVGEDEALLFSRARGDGCRAGVHRSVAREEAAEEISKALCRGEHIKPRHPKSCCSIQLYSYGLHHKVSAGE